MIKKLAVPALVLAMAGFACSSSTTPSTGTGGSAGHGTGGAVAGSTGHTGGVSGGGTSGGGTAGGGTSGGGTSGGGHAGGASGGGTSGGGTAGGGTSGGGHAGGASGGGTSGGGTSGGGTSGGGHAGGASGGGGAGGSGVQVMASCTTTDANGTTPLAADVFCTNLLANCASPPSGYATMSDCMTSYSAGVAARKNCQSYHLCWGVEGITNSAGPGPATHCPHAEAVSNCVQTQ